MFGLIKKKDKAMEKGYQSYNILVDYIKKDMEYNNKSCYTPKEMLDLLYSSSEYRDFVVDSLVAKKFSQKISMIKICVAIAAMISLIALFTFFGLNILSGILTAVIVIFTILFFMLFKEGKTYTEYYEETMVKVLLLSLNNEYHISKNNKNRVINKDYINRNIDIGYDKYSTKYNCKFESYYEVGDDFNLELENIIKKKDSRGNTTTKEETIFDGFSIVSKNKQPHKILNGSVIKIREDHNIISSLIEDTVNSMVQSKKDFSFNSEILNKHLDCKIARTGFTSDVDQKMFEVTKIITPVFEERMLFLDERYNAFNMNISDDEFSFTVNMKKDTYQQFKSGDLFKFESNYKDKEFNTNIYSDSNFEYDKLYPILERLFLRKYFRTIYNYQMDSTRFNSDEEKMVNKYETEIKEIMNMTWKEFSQINGDYVKELKDEINQKYSEISEKEELTKLENLEKSKGNEDIKDDKEYLKEIEKEKNNV